MKNVIHSHAKMHRTARAETPVSLAAYSYLGRHCRLGAMSYFSEYVTCSSGTQIGRFCSVARYAEIGAIDHPTDFLSTHPFQYSTHAFARQPEYEAIDRVDYATAPPPIIGNDVWIGAKAIILRGVTVGDGAVVGSGAFVNKDVPPYAIVVGTPARILRYRFEPPIIERLLASRWWDRPLSELSHLPFNDIEATLALLEATPQTSAAE